jgi:hypothetical protein
MGFFGCDAVKKEILGLDDGALKSLEQAGSEMLFFIVFERQRSIDYQENRSFRGSDKCIYFPCSILP